MDAILDIAARHTLKVVEDCAEAIGAEYKGKRVGTLGDVGCFSFFANKVVTTGEGGFVTTKDEKLHHRMKRLRDHGMEPGRRYWHVEPGFNFRMTNMQAAVGLAQMERVDAFLEGRLKVARLYTELLSGVEGIRVPFVANWAKSIYWLYVFEVDGDRDALMKRLAKRNVETRYVFPALHLQPAFGSQAANTRPVAERYAEQGLCLPISNTITEEDARRVVRTVIEEHQANQAITTHA
jgi:perosamine synthetase